MSVTPITVSLPPGVVSAPTKAVKSANYRETNLVRWVNGRVTPIGPWQRIDYSAFASRLRAVHRWNTNAGRTVTAYLCEGHIYVDNGTGAIEDVSPVVPLVTPGSIPAPAIPYSSGLYGVGPFAPTPIAYTTADVFKLDNWGEDLIIMTSPDGRLLRWKASAPSDPCEAVPNAPENNHTFVVAPQRYVLLFGADGDFAKIWWNNEEDIESWNVASVSTKAGDYNLQPASPIMCATISAGQVVLFCENGMGWVGTFQGLPFVWGFEPFSTGAVPLSPHALMDTPSGCIWMSEDGIWVYTAGSAMPMECPLWDWADKLMDVAASKIFANMCAIYGFSEIYFFFATEPNATVNDKYMVWNFKDKWWANGTMKRVCGFQQNYTGYPIMSDGANVYQHESGNVYALLPGEELPWVQTFAFNTDGGSKLTTVLSSVPDVGENPDVLSFRLDYQIDRSGQNISMSTPELGIVGGRVGFRCTGRDFSMTVKQSVNVVKDWTFGDFILDTVRRGKQ